MFAVLASEPLAAGIVRLVVRASLVARRCRAGQFVMVRVAEGAARVPLSIADYDAAAGTITLVVEAVGKSTARLIALRAGDEIRDLLGPLGQPAPVDHYGAVACVAGGIGAAALLPVVRTLVAAGNTVYTVLGARNEASLILERELGGLSRELVITTDDGSRGRRGVVTDVLSGVLARAHIPVVFTAGSTAMMRAVADLTRPLDVFTYASLNSTMVDGIGMCGGCRVTVDGLTRLTCADGPQFDAHGIDFDELLRRRPSTAHPCEAHRRPSAERP